jgi:hypothetical protein
MKLDLDRALRIDIEEELRAAARGECLVCRIGARHKIDSTCPRATHWADVWCARGRHDVPLVMRVGTLVRRGTCAHCGEVVF